MQNDNLETHTSPRYWDSWPIGHEFELWYEDNGYVEHYTVKVLGPNCVWGVK